MKPHPYVGCGMNGIGLVMRELYKLASKRAKHYSKNKDGATAIEFALLAIPFFMLLFAILELAIIFFISSTLSHAVSESGRQIRTGNFQNCGQAAFKTAVCDKMKGLGSCNQSLRIDVVSEPDFKSIMLPDVPNPPASAPGDPKPTIPNGAYDESPAGNPVVVRAVYYHKLLLPPQLTRLENAPGSGTNVISVSTAFRNEPFPTQACAPAAQ